NLDAAQAELAELERGTRPERIAAARADVARIAAGIAALDLDLEDLVLRAPFAGSVAMRHVHEGAIVPVGQAAITLVETSALEAWIGVPPEEVSDLQAIQPVLRVRRQIRPIGALRALPELDLAARTVQVVLPLISGLDMDLRAGELAEIVIERQVLESGYWIPTLALSQGVRGLWSCFVVPAGDAEQETRVMRASVEVLHVDGDRSYVRGTLTTGDRVVLSGPQRIVSGQLIRTTVPATQER
ncbi:MAG: RND family efflux transporter MFP subunit, partial [Planctomycetota bacterium]